MDLYQLAMSVVEGLEAEGIPYMVTGAIAFGVYGIPRSTKDVDVVIALETAEPLNRLERRLGHLLEFDPQVSFETITGSLRHILKSRTRPPITVELFELGKDDFVRCRFDRRREEFSAQLGRAIEVPTAEDVVVQKLRWGRSKDIDDARDVIAVQSPANLDMAYIEKWCGLHGTMERLRAVIASIPADLR